MLQIFLYLGEICQAFLIDLHQIYSLRSHESSNRFATAGALPYSYQAAGPSSAANRAASFTEVAFVATGPSEDRLAWVVVEVAS